MKIIKILIAIFLIVGCAPTPQYRGQLIIQNCTENAISVQSNLACPNGDYAANVSIAPGKTTEIAATATYPEDTAITIDKFFTNHQDAAVTVTATIDGHQSTRTWKYADRNSDKKHLFDLNDCQRESGEDARKNFTYINYIFMIHEEDLKD